MFACHIPHSQHSSPKSTRFFPPRPAPRPNTPFLPHFCNSLTFSHLPSEAPAPHLPHPIPRHHTPPFDPRSLPFRGSIPYLSHLDTLPPATRYMPNARATLRLRPFHPPLFSLRPPKTAPPRPLFHPKFRPHFSTKYLYALRSRSPPPGMILWNVMGWVSNGHAQYSATRNGAK